MPSNSAPEPAWYPRLRVAVSLAVVTAILAAPATAQRDPGPTDLRLDHFRCYTAWPSPESPVPPRPLAFLQDQFDVALEREELVEIGPPARFCNPVTKRVDIPGRGGSADRDDRNHLTMYEIREIETDVPSFFWRVLVGNQFGRQQLSVREPVLLAVPTQKLIPGPHDPPQDLDHFKCYKARGKSLGLKVFLDDQFETDDVLVLDPRLFCNPVRKQLGTVPPVDIDNADAHLTCYDIAIPPGQLGFSQIVLVEIFNQLAPLFYPPFFHVVTDEDLLCVPSLKLKVFGTPGSLTSGGR